MSNWAYMKSILQDVRYAVRSTRRRPGFTIFVIATLAAGIGMNAAVFTLINAVLLKSLPVADPASLYFIELFGARGGGGGGSYPWFRHLQQAQTSFETVSAFQPRDLRVTIDGSYESVSGQFAAGNLFDLLGVRAALGRTLRPDDDATVGQGGSNGPVAVIGYHYWETRFGRRPDILGRTIQLEDKTAVIVGVLPPEFFGMQPGRSADVTFPITLASPGALRNPTASWLTVIGRLPHGNVPARARAEVEVLLGQDSAGRALPPAVRNGYFAKVRLMPASQGFSSLRLQFSKPLWLLFALVATLLLVACANLASLFLTQATARRNELVTRQTLGAGRGRLVLQMATESTILILAGTAAGLMVGHYAVPALVAMMPGADGQYVISAPLDGRVLMFICGIASLTCLLFGVAPALWITSALERSGLAASSRSIVSQKARFASSLVVLQVALSLVLMVGAGVLARSLKNLNHAIAGFRSDGVATMRVEANMRAYERSRLLDLWRSVKETAQAVPSVSFASLSSLTPVTSRTSRAMIEVPGFSATSERDLEITRNEAMPEYFAVMRVELVAGRYFLPTDTERSSKVILLNEAAARFYFGSAEAAVGSPIRIGKGTEGATYQIVGIVQNTTHRSPREEFPRMMHLPLAQALEENDSLILSVRTNDDPEQIGARVRDQISRSYRDVLVRQVRTLERQVDDSLRQERTLAALSGLFSGIALLLAAGGLYGVIWQGVASRIPEIGLRMALGATRSGILRLVVLRSLAVVALGLILGIGGSLACLKLLDKLVFGMNPVDVPTIIASVGVLIGVGSIAIALPLARAMRIDPAGALRTQ